MEKSRVFVSIVLFLSYTGGLFLCDCSHVCLLEEFGGLSISAWFDKQRKLVWT